MLDTDVVLRRRKIRVALAVLAGCLASGLTGAVFVRVLLDNSDRRPYAGAATERQYVLIAVVALIIWWGGSVLSIVLGRRAWRRVDGR